MYSSSAAIELMTRLPPEIRIIVYEHITHKWASDKPYPETVNRHRNSNVVIARRNKQSLCGPSFDFHTQSHPCMSVDGRQCANDLSFEQKYGIMDYYKEDEWAGVASSVKAICEFRNQIDRCQNVKLYIAVGQMLEEYMKWFWDRAVMDVQFRNTALPIPGEVGFRKATESTLDGSVSHLPDY